MTSGADANEMALQLARSYHVERGEPQRWQVISPAQAYHGPTMQTLALTGRPGLHGPFGPYFPSTCTSRRAPRTTIPPARRRSRRSTARSSRPVPRTCRRSSARGSAPRPSPAYTPPKRFWDGLAERRERHGFLVLFDEVVTGVGRTGTWFAGNATPCTPDLIATAKGLGAGYAAIGAVLCRQEVFDAVAEGSRRFPLGHTWDGAPLSCAVGLAVLEILRAEGLVDHVRERGARLRDELEASLEGIAIVDEVRGHGYLLGVSFADPRDRGSFLPRELRAAARIDAAALERGLITLSTQPTRDGYAGDQTLFAPPFTTSEEELGEMVSRFSDAVRGVVAEEWRPSSTAPTTTGGAG